MSGQQGTAAQCAKCTWYCYLVLLLRIVTWYCYSGIPGIGWHSGVAIVDAPALEHLMTHSRQLLDDVKVEPQTLCLLTTTCM